MLGPRADLIRRASRSVEGQRNATTVSVAELGQLAPWGVID